MKPICRAVLAATALFAVCAPSFAQIEDVKWVARQVEFANLEEVMSTVGEADKESVRAEFDALESQLNEEMNGSAYYEFKSDGTLDCAQGGGTWAYADGKESIEVKIGGVPDVYPIEASGETELSLRMHYVELEIVVTFRPEG